MGTKKGRAYRASPKALGATSSRARAVFRPVSSERKGFWAEINGQFGRDGQKGGRERWLAEPKPRSGEGWRPGLDLNQVQERCTALRVVASATGPGTILPLTAA
ncbi:sarcosine oxidase subunit alpha [Bradyrhizobium oligotrophicum S58]|uniref:Sarcosine oxidase subunit alpha n=1 Tax=Bradyrhizobium oligotrophicum S58 TaxID=1245469 RepID=M4Z3E8_9BRAD|nr:sarcosine oxidase subunit alpha [Bradyrhizobium oligotrophicum S58]